MSKKKRNTFCSLHNRQFIGDRAEVCNLQRYSLPFYERLLTVIRQAGRQVGRQAGRQEGSQVSYLQQDSLLSFPRTTIDNHPLFRDLGPSVSFRTYVISWKVGRQAGRQTVRQTGRQAAMQTGRQAGRRPGRPAGNHPHPHPFIYTSSAYLFRFTGIRRGK